MRLRHFLGPAFALITLAGSGLDEEAQRALAGGNASRLLDEA
jgi:hypothetical protein